MGATSHSRCRRVRPCCHFWTEPGAWLLEAVLPPNSGDPRLKVLWHPTPGSGILRKNSGRAGEDQRNRDVAKNLGLFVELKKSRDLFRTGLA